MPASAGESHLITLFADVHYYFSSPTTKPQHHRFSRGSYLYLFNNPTERRTKIEVANHAGTPEQDAFSGYFDHVSRVSYSYKQSTLFTLNVDGTSVQGHEQWHLPSYNERNEQKYLYKMNTLDVYFWTEKDASSFLKHLQSILPADKLEIKDAPARVQSPAEHNDTMSPVVQQLEQTAIGTQFPPRSESTTSAMSAPGPLTPAASARAGATPQPAPMGYNPAAPAAPEPIAHREKTPPPPDAGGGTGLADTGNYQSFQQAPYGNVPNTFQNSSQNIPQHTFFSGPPQQQQQQIRHPSISSFPGPPTQGTPPQRTGSNGTGSFPPPPPPPGGGPSPQPYNPSFAPPPGMGQPASPPPNQTSFNRQSSYGALPGQTQFASYQPSFGPTALASPGLPGTPGHQQQQPPTPSAPPAYSSATGLPGPPPGQAPYNPQQPQQSQQQSFGYSTYSYSSSAQSQPAGYNPSNPQSGGYGGDVHGQVYRPTEGEATAHGRPQQPQRQNTSETRVRLEGKVNQVEQGVGKFMKRLDKLW